MPALGHDVDSEVAPWRLRVRNALFPSDPQRATVGRGWFENMIFVLLMLNAFTAAFYDPLDRECKERRCETLRAIEVILTIVYMFEVGVHGVAFGFSQLRQPLRLLDITVILCNVGLFCAFIAGVTEANVSLNVIRVSRLLRPIFTTMRFRSIRVLIVSITRCIFQLTDIILLYSLFLLWYSVAGVYQFGGSLRTRCVADEYFNESFMNSSVFATKLNLTNVGDYVCGGRYDQLAFANYSDVGLFCTPLQTCDMTPDTLLKGYRCPWGYTCTAVNSNMYDGVVGFDNLGQALLTTFTCVTFQLWYEAMFWAFDSTDVLAFGYFVSLVIIGAYLIITLTVVIITVEFEKGKQLERDKIRELMAQQNLTADGKQTFVGVVQQLILAQKQLNLAVKELHRPDMTPSAAPVDNAQEQLAREPESTQPETAAPALIGTEGLSLAAPQTRPQPATASSIGAASAKEVNELTKKFIEEMDVESEDGDEGGIRMRVADDDALSTWRVFLKERVVDTWGFNYLTVFVIIANLGVLCYDHYGISDADLLVLNSLNIAFTTYFTIEAVLRFLSTKPRLYIMDVHNVFDLFIIVSSWLEISVERINLPFIRALRALRCVKLLKNYPSLYDWLVYIAAATKTSPLLILLLLLFCFVFSCLAMQIFGGMFCGLDPAQQAVPAKGICEGLPRAHFDDFGQALITSFQIITADDWNFVLIDAILARGAVYAVPFCIYFYVGNYVVLNLLIAILLSANSESDDVADGDKSGLTGDGSKDEEKDRKERERREVLALASGTPGGGGGGGADGADDDDPENPAGEDPEPSTATRSAPRTDHIDAFVASLLDRPAYLIWFDKSRIAAQRLMEHRFTEFFVSLVIITGSISMGLENPLLPPDAPYSRNLYYLDISVTVFYCLETAINCYGYGVVSGYTSYLRRDHWNKFDFILVIVSILGVALDGVDGSEFVRNLKVLRAIRPLRLVRHSPGMKLVLSSLFGSIHQMRNVAVIFTMILGMWGIMGVFLFKGSLRVCAVGDEYLPELPLENCTAAGGSYVNDGPNFDNIGAAIVTLFTITTLEGWAPIAYRVMDGVAPGQPRLRDANPWASLYVIFMACFGGLFLVNLFVSVLIDSYNREKRSASMQRSLRKAREEDGWHLTNKRLLRLLPHHHQRRLKGADALDILTPLSPMKFFGVKSQPASPASDSSSTPRRESGVSLTELLKSPGEAIENSISKSRTRLRDIVRHPRFMYGTAVIICANFIAMAVEHYPQSESSTIALRVVNIVFTAIFAAEASVKIYAESWTIYFQSKWNRLDFFVAVVSVVGVAMESVYNPRASALIRAVRVVRLARLARGRLEIDSLISKFGHALASLVHVGAVILLVFFVFAVVGMKMFGLVRRGPFGTSTGIDSHSNFERLDTAMLLLTRMMTGGNWGDVMDSCSVQPPFCTPQINDCGLPAWATAIYFVLFIIVSMFVLKNLLTAVLLDSFASSGRNTAIEKDDADAFYAAWLRFDPMATLEMTTFDVLHFIRALPQKSVLGFNKLSQRRRINLELKFLTALQIVDIHSRVTMESVVDVLCRMQFKHVTPPADRVFVHQDAPPHDASFRYRGTGVGGEDETPEEAYSRVASLVLINSVISRLKRRREARKQRQRDRQRRGEAAVDIKKSESGGVTTYDIKIDGLDDDDDAYLPPIPAPAPRTVTSPEGTPAARPTSPPLMPPPRRAASQPRDADDDGLEIDAYDI